jgi:hypothetical protein
MNATRASLRGLLRPQLNWQQALTQAARERLGVVARWLHMPRIAIEVCDAKQFDD